MNLERQLIEALRRKQPPPGMVERVAARINALERPVAAPSFWRAHQAALRFAAGIALVAALGFGVLRQREAQRERGRGEFAAKQLMTALQIASETLNDAQRIVQQQQNQ